MSDKQPMDATPKKRNMLLRILAFVLTAAMVLGALALVVFRDELNLDAFRRWFAYRSLQTGQTDQTEPFAHGGGERLDIARLEDGYLFASTAGAQYYSFGGKELSSHVVRMEKPVLSTSDNYGVVYEAGGDSLYLFGQSHEPYVYTAPNGGMLSARVNTDGWLTVTARQEHYRGGVTVLDKRHQPVITLNYSSAFVTDAILSPDGDTVVVVTISQTDGAFHSTLHFYSTHESEAFNTVTLDGFTVLDMDFDSQGLWLLGESSLITLSSKGEALGQYYFDPTYLKGYALEGDGFACLLLGRYRAGSASDLVSVGRDGQLIASRELNSLILSLSACGRYLATLSGQRLEIFTRDLTQYAVLEDTRHARHVTLCSDASALLADSQDAWLYIPS